MKLSPYVCLTALLAAASIFEMIPGGAMLAQQQQDKAAALKQAIAANQQRLKQYKWVETTIVKMKGEEKSRTQKLCFYGPDGKVQKQALSAPPPPKQAPGGVKGRVVAKKKEELTTYMQNAVVLIHQYVPPDKERIDTVRAAGGLAVSPIGPGAMKVDLHDYFKKGDVLTVNLDTNSGSLQTVSIKSWLEKPDDAVTLSVTFNRQADGLNYPANIVLNAPSQKVEVDIQNSNYQSLAPQAQAPAASGGNQGLDALTGPIALYPDALIAQILTAAVNFDSLQKFSGWMKTNSNLKGGELQDAAQKAGFDACYIALAPFPQVIDMMMQKPDWTKKLGAAFDTDKTAVFDSIQRLRAKAQSVGNLKTTSQQQVQTETTSSGQQVIVIQPANPQVVYVPQYNPQVVYVSAPPPPPPSGGAVVAASAMAFTAGVIIGANSSHYYHGPYAWHGAAMYNEAWEHRAEYAEHRQDYYQQNASQRAQTSQANQAQRQAASQANQAQRQSAIQSGQAQTTAAQTTAASRQPQAQPAATTAQAQRGQMQGAAATSSAGTGQAAAQRQGMQSGGFSGYQSGSAARAESQRGNRSMASSRSGGGRRR